MTSMSSQSSLGSGKSRRFFKLKLSLPVSSASLKHLSNGIFPDMVGFTCYNGNIGTLSRHLFRRLGDILENIPQPRASTAHGSVRITHKPMRPPRDSRVFSRVEVSCVNMPWFPSLLHRVSVTLIWLVVNLNKKWDLWFCLPWGFKN